MKEEEEEKEVDDEKLSGLIMPISEPQLQWRNDATSAACSLSSSASHLFFSSTTSLKPILFLLHLPSCRQFIYSPV